MNNKLKSGLGLAGGIVASVAVWAVLGHGPEKIKPLPEMDDLGVQISEENCLKISKQHARVQKLIKACLEKGFAVKIVPQ